MGLAVCRECDAQVSDSAKSCPKCGVSRPVKPQKKPVSRFALILLAAAVVGTIAISKLDNQATEEAAKADAARLAALPPQQRDAELRTRAKAASEAATRKAAEEKDELKRKAILEDVGLAEVTCQMAAEKAANDPSSVDWMRSERRFFYANSSKSKAVSIQPMRAKNAMGGLIRTGVKCELVRQDGTWQVAKMSELH